MIRAALLLCAGIIIAACFACAPPPPSPPPPLPASAAASQSGTGTGNPNCSATQFTSGVQILSAPYDPSASTTYPVPPPTSATTVDPTSPMGVDLVAAFGEAPDGLKKQLCMTSVSIFPTSCSGSNTCGVTESWGFRNHYNYNQRYIGLSTALWQPGPNAVKFHQYETGLLQQLLGGWTSAYFPGSSSDPADSSQMTVLAVLAHEFGHILWYDTFYPTGSFNPNPSSFCNGNNFFVSWENVNPPPPWRTFGYLSNDSEHVQDPTSDNITVAQLRKYINRQSDSQLYNILTNLYAPYGRWASLFAAFSPDEDFVETFKLAVLENATSTPLQQLKLVITLGLHIFPGGNIPGDDQSGGGKVQLDAKKSCFAALLAR